MCNCSFKQLKEREKNWKEKKFKERKKRDGICQWQSTEVEKAKGMRETLNGEDKTCD